MKNTTARLLRVAAMALLCVPSTWAQTPGGNEDGRFVMLEEQAVPVKDPRLVSDSLEEWTGEDGNRLLKGVTVPTLTPFLPEHEDAAGRPAIVIAPGGAFFALAMDHEGYDVARWLASQGIAAFVLKYRLIGPVADGAEKGFGDLLGQGISDASEDASAAIEVVRGRAQEWNIDPERVGFLGFSAGAIAGYNATVLQTEASLRPDILALVYGPLAKPEVPLPGSLPPLWAAVSGDDLLFGSDISLIPAWRETDSSSELHYYESGGHGWGFSGAEGTTTVGWSDQFLAWLRIHHYVGEL